MKESFKFYKCEICGNLTGLVVNTGVPLVCCGQDMTALVPNTVEASTEKHLPSVSVPSDCDCGCDCLCVQVGSVPHPMEDSHYIEFVFVQTEKGGQRKALKPGAEPKLCFAFTDDKPVAVYAYCNLHGLWKVDV